MLTVVEHPAVMVRKTTGTKIEIEAFVKVANLLGLNALLVHFFEHRAPPRGVIPSTGALGQFDNLAVIVCTCQFIRSC